ncbi:hypothetical protein AWV80_18250, partial [Cupriavidus sp. UYMU48A]
MSRTTTLRTVASALLLSLAAAGATHAATSTGTHAGDSYGYEFRVRNADPYSDGARFVATDMPVTTTATSSAARTSIPTVRARWRVSTAAVSRPVRPQLATKSWRFAAYAILASLGVSTTANTSSHDLRTAGIQRPADRQNT